MAKPAARLKVFQTHIGFDDWVIAAPSQKAALEAWDVSQNLFASGEAFVTIDAKAVALAMKTPGKAVALPRKRKR